MTTDRFVSDLVGTPNCWFCHAKAHIVVEDGHVQQPTYYIVQQPGHSAGDHDYSEDQTDGQVYTEEVQVGNQVYTGEVEQTDSRVVTDYKTEYKIVTEGMVKIYLGLVMV